MTHYAIHVSWVGLNTSPTPYSRVRIHSDWDGLTISVKYLDTVQSNIEQITPRLQYVQPNFTTPNRSTFLYFMGIFSCDCLCV
jgi:hypothetical protein